MKLVECIPNFSEARRPDVVDAIVAAVTSVEGVVLLDRSSDEDHNRTVLTFAGEPQNVSEAAFRAIEKAAALINLDEHEGAHPRIGATDVVPFVPLEDVTMEECVELARALGKRVGEELHIPVYLYEYAATRPERVNLAAIRKGEYETLKEEIGVNPAREPDFGPAKIGTAGATVIGARDPLVAFNVYLTTDEVAVAKKIARAVRHSSGGLRFVKALGLLVEGRAQVSMNLTNYRKTPIARVVEFIRREAARYGVHIHHSEVIGLIPQEALSDAAAWYLQLDGFEKSQILETRLFEAQREKAGDFLEDIAAPLPTPGGGSAAAYAGALGAALTEMTARLTLGKKKYADVQEEIAAIAARAEELRRLMRKTVEADAAAFDAMMDAFRLPKTTPEEKEARAEAIQRATLHAADVPLETARLAVEGMSLALRAAQIGNLNAITDAASGAAMARAALTASGYNVRINLASLKDESQKAERLQTLRTLEARADELDSALREILSTRGGFSI